MGVGCGVGAAEGFKDGAGDGAKVGAKLSVGGSVGLGERVGDGVQFLGRGDGLGVGFGVGSVGGAWGRGVGASVCAWAVMRSMTVRSRRMARRGGGGAGRGARARVRCLVYAARACGRFDRVGCPISAQFALCWELPNSGQQRSITAHSAPRLPGQPTQLVRRITNAHGPPPPRARAMEGRTSAMPTTQHRHR